jgi:myosin heavy subunit
LEGIRICRRGYPNRLTFPEFIRRYRILAPNSVTVANENVDMRDVVIELCRNMCIGDDRLQIGKTKVFCKVGLRAELELWRKERINALFIGLQAWIRWHNQQKVTRKRYNEWLIYLKSTKYKNKNLFLGWLFKLFRMLFEKMFSESFFKICSDYPTFVIVKAPKLELV